MEGVAIRRCGGSCVARGPGSELAVPAVGSKAGVAQAENCVLGLRCARASRIFRGRLTADTCCPSTRGRCGTGTPRRSRPGARGPDGDGRVVATARSILRFIAPSLRHWFAEASGVQRNRTREATSRSGTRSRSGDRRPTSWRGGPGGRTHTVTTTTTGSRRRCHDAEVTAHRFTTHTQNVEQRVPPVARWPGSVARRRRSGGDPTREPSLHTWRGKPLVPSN